MFRTHCLAVGTGGGSSRDWKVAAEAGGELNEENALRAAWAIP